MSNKQSFQDQKRLLFPAILMVKLDKLFYQRNLIHIHRHIEIQLKESLKMANF